MASMPQTLPNGFCACLDPFMSHLREGAPDLQKPDGTRERVALRGLGKKEFDDSVAADGCRTAHPGLPDCIPPRLSLCSTI